MPAEQSATVAAPSPEILAAARRVLAEHGYAGLTQERIAEEAGISRVTMHRKGLGKDEVFEVLRREATEGFEKAQWSALGTEGSGAERLRAGLEITCERCEENLDVMLAIRAQADASYHQAQQRPDPPSAHPPSDPLMVMVREGIADGSLRPSDAAETSMLLANWVGWTYVHIRTSHGWGAEGARELVVRRAMEALAP